MKNYPNDYPNADMDVSEKSARMSRIVGAVLLIMIFILIFLNMRHESEDEVKMDSVSKVQKHFLIYFNPDNTSKILTDPEYCEKMKLIPDTLNPERETYFTLNGDIAPFYFDTIFGFNPTCGTFRNPKFIEGVKEGDWVRFYDKEIGPAQYFFSQLTKDPAQTSWWYYGSFSSYKTLSEGIISCAGTSRVWKQKFEDMMTHGIVDAGEEKSMSSIEISMALYREYEYASSREIISKEQAYEEIINIGY